MHSITKHYRDQMSKFTEGQEQHLKPKYDTFHGWLTPGIGFEETEKEQGRSFEDLKKLVEEIDSPKESRVNDLKREFKTPNHYDNSKGSLYKFAEDQNLNSYEFDICKRVVRCRKKGQFLEDINKTIAVLELYKKEYKQDFFCNDEAVQKAQDLGEPIERCEKFCGKDTCVE